jgi:hypothetical protein
LTLFVAILTLLSVFLVYVFEQRSKQKEALFSDLEKTYINKYDLWTYNAGRRRLMSDNPKEEKIKLICNELTNAKPEDEKYDIKLKQNYERFNNYKIYFFL